MTSTKVPLTDCFRSVSSGRFDGQSLSFSTLLYSSLAHDRPKRSQSSYVSSSSQHGVVPTRDLSGCPGKPGPRGSFFSPSALAAPVF